MFRHGEKENYYIHSLFFSLSYFFPISNYIIFYSSKCCLSNFADDIFMFPPSNCFMTLNKIVTQLCAKLG